MEQLIIYIHGFGGSAYSNKASILEKHFSKVYAPSLPMQPVLAIKNLEEMLTLFQEHYEVVLVGSSLGGFYALYLAERFNIKTVLINPSIKPFVTLEKRIGKRESYFDGSYYEWSQQHVTSLQEYECKKIQHPKNFFLCVQTADEILDYKEALKKLPNSLHEVQEGGSHEFFNFEAMMPKLKQFFKQG